MNGKIITIINQKGGVGKTTTALNLSAGLAENFRDTLLIDLDGQANTTQGLGLTSENLELSVYDILMNNSHVEDVIKNTEVDLLDLMPAHPDLNGAKIELVEVKNREYRLKKALKNLKKSYDFIIIDSPPSLDLLTINALTASDSALITIQCEYYALEGLGRLVDTLYRIKRGLNPTLEIEGVLMTMHDKRTNLSRQVMDEIKKHFKDAVYRTVIPRNVRLAEAPSFGETIYQYAPNSTGTKAYKKLTQEFLEDNGYIINNVLPD